MKYELTYIVSTNLAETEQPALQQAVLEYLRGQNFSVQKQPHVLGRHRLAYPIKKQKNGFYVTLEFEATEGQGLKELDNKLKHNPNILRHLLIKREPDAKYGPAKPMHFFEKQAMPVRVKEISRRQPRPEPKPAVKMKSEDIDKKLDEILSKEPELE